MIAVSPSVEMLKVNPHWAKLPLFDRKGWRTMAFGEFAESVNERVELGRSCDACAVTQPWNRPLWLMKFTSSWTVLIPVACTYGMPPHSLWL